jgi:hypothetical protein
MARKFGTGLTCSGDCTHCSIKPGVDFTSTEMEEIQQRMEKGIEKYKIIPGQPKRCLDCYHRWVLKPGEAQACPKCGSTNIAENIEGPVGDQVKPTRIEVVFPPSNRTPEEELERAERLRRNALGLVPPADTVGDLSKVTAEKNSPRAVRQLLRTMADSMLSVGDLSVVTDERESFRAQADAMHAEKPEGATVGDLFYGPRATDFKTAVSESQALEAERVKRNQKRAHDAWILRNPSALEAQREEVVKKTKQFLLEAEQQRRGAA